MRWYKYFVSFLGSKEKKIGRVYGHGIYVINRKLSTPKGIIEMQKEIEKSAEIKNVVILFFQKV